LLGKIRQSNAFQVAVFVPTAFGTRKNKALLMKSTDDLFTQPALEAAKKWKFTPAIMNDKPVLVWIAIPFRFRL
jgi:TonB family protein